VPPIVFQCPVSGQKVQGFIAKDMIGPHTACVPIDCVICGRSHLIDPKTGKVPGAADD